MFRLLSITWYHQELDQSQIHAVATHIHQTYQDGNHRAKSQYHYFFIL